MVRNKNWTKMNNRQNQILVDQMQPNYENFPLAIFLIGANGSGKSTMRNYLNLTEIQTNIDPDVLNRICKKRYPKTYQIESARQALVMYDYAINNHFNLCIESTLAGHGSINRIQIVKDAGYHVIGYFIGLNNVELNCQRVRDRVSHGGHDIAPYLIKKRYTESLENLIKIENCFDELYIVDNSFNAYDLQFSRKNKHLIQSDNLELWAKELLKIMVIKNLDER
jgi:predicted ABC-type ATPase